MGEVFCSSGRCGLVVECGFAHVLWMGCAGKDLGGREPPLSERGLSPSKPPSLTENFPTEPRHLRSENLFRFLEWREHGGSFWVLGGRFFSECGCRACFAGGRRRESVCLSSVQIDPPSSVAYATASPQGEAFLQDSFALHNKATE